MTRINFFLFLIMLMTFGCNSQNAVATNEIIKTKDNLFGVKSKTGKLLIDSIYREIKIVYDYTKLTLPPKSRQAPKQLEYYLVSNSNNQKALFDKNGTVVFDFIDCSGIVADGYTQTVVTTTTKQGGNQARSYLYNLNGALLFETSFEQIAFIKNTDLIALIVEDGSNDEYYLYNPFTKKKLGPFDHFNIYNEDSNLPMGMKESDFEKYKKLNILKVRREVDNDYIWGIIDAKGNEVLPLEYRNLKMFSDQDKSHPAFKKATKPEGVTFIFKGAHISKPSTGIYFDSDFVRYEFKIISVAKGAYQIEKMLRKE